MYPIRHTNYQTTCQRAKRLKFILGANAVPSQEKWQAIGAGLNDGDELADNVVAWMKGYGFSAGRGLFDRVLEKGLADLSAKELAAAKPLVALFNTVDTPPDWVDEELLNLGSSVINRCHPVSYYVLRNAGLMAGYLAADLNKPLLLTGALQGGAARRLAQTMKWYSDCSDTGGLVRSGQGFKSTLEVRLLHAIIRNKIAASSDWDMDDMGLPINQTDMVATWLAFSVIFLFGARTMGVTIAKQESKAVMHLWHYACWLLGIDNKWLTDDERDGRLLLVHILSSFRPADKSSWQMGRALRAETAEIPYSGIRPLRWRWEQFKHFSTTMLFVGPGGMKKLGLPMWVPPVYPPVTALYNLPRSVLVRHIKPLRKRAESTGMQNRHKQVQLHFDGAEQAIAKAAL